jgi:hypothetical protein
MAYDQSSGGNNQLPASRDQILANMRAAVPTRRHGGSGINYVRVDHRTGAVTFGRDDVPFPLDHQYAVPWREVRWGYKEFTGRSVTNSVLCRVAAGPCPLPPGDFAPFGVDGPRACMELKLCSITEPGFVNVFSSLNESNTSRILDLWGDITAQFSVNPEFANPVARVEVDSYTNSFGTTFVLVYRIEDWIANDGATLLSTVDPAPAPLTGGAAAAVPF